MADDEDYFLPLEGQRVFGAGIRRKRVPFVRSSEHHLSTTRPSTTTPTKDTSTGPNIANKYLSIVLPRDQQSQARTAHSAPPSPGPPPRCEVCNLPVQAQAQTRAQPQPVDTDTEPEPEPVPDPALPAQEPKPHEATLAHQLCLAHSHPPSHLDRRRPGLRYLSSYGWDPDSRLGLGRPGREGIREPVKGRVKRDTVGLGNEGPPTPPRAAGAGGDRGAGRGKVQKLNAKEVRRGHVQERRKGDRLREMFYRSEDLERYLGGSGAA